MCIVGYRHFFTGSLFLYVDDVLFQFEAIFHPYTKYCLEQKASLEYIRDKYKENELFKMFITVGAATLCQWT